MEGRADSSLYPLHRSKTLHLVRHAQGIHNVAGEKDHKAYSSPKFFDAHITPLGWSQVDNLREHVNECGLAKRIELVITSPLLRTMQTAVGVFGGESYLDGMDVHVHPLMIENVGNSNRSAISSLNCPPFIAVETCRERLMENEEDILWDADKRESNEALATRGLKFINWLWTRPEKEIAIVTHSAFLECTLQMFGNDCHPSIKNEINKHFANCELRSMVLVDTNMLAMVDTSSSNYPGQKPHGLGLPSDVAHEELPKKEDQNYTCYCWIL
ncbi:phosphoglycerate mutase-like protein 1 isoform X1 [Dioscorea cayenensis subsp. rotundata]|uniref:Phosphoglycerate mutase-like protein 1 isoform X1 n=1 Tax=Dioscorea cayennensis subsp. rotundata TaxID=55577 RepID=A0AB40CGZ4_DIOCR|nr:phosphoglycerate mutase-like protein 1 isoform X1 [Dioscorea cayenensis subsp. rotundata]